MSLIRFFWRSKYLSEAKRISWYPPFWVMRLRHIQIDNGWRSIRITLPLTWFAKNHGGGMFGGFQASLADPIAALACAKVYRGYTVWTRKLTVDFVKEGRSDLELRFDFPQKLEQQVAEELKSKQRSNPEFHYAFYDQEGHVCSRISCIVAIRPDGYIPAVRQ